MSYRQRMLRATRSPESARAFAEYRSVSRELARSLLYPKKGSPNAQRDSDDVLTQRREDLERTWARTGRELPEPVSCHRHFAQRIGQIVALWAASLSSFSATSISRQPIREISNLREAGSARYVAFVIQQRKPITFLDLGEAHSVDAAVVALRRAIRSGASPSPYARELRHLVWAPVEKSLDPATTTIYICPDSLLTGVPWGALPSNEGDSPLLERYAMAVVPSGQFVLDQMRRARQKTKGPARLLAIGDVAFGRWPNQMDFATKLAQRSVVRGPGACLDTTVGDRRRGRGDC